MDLVDRNGQRIDELLAAQGRLLNSVGSVHDLVRWRNEVVRLARRCDDALCDLAALLVDGEESGRLVAQAGFTAWESLLAAAITRALDNGDLSPDADPARLATGLMAALQGGLLLARTARDVRRLETALDMALGYVQAHALRRRGTT